MHGAPHVASGTEVAVNKEERRGRGPLRRMRVGIPPWLLRVQQNTCFRASFQLAAGTALLMAALSPPTVWDALSLDPVLANPQLALMLFSLTALLNLGTGLAPLQLAAEICSGALLGGSFGLGCIYLTNAAGNSGGIVAKGAVNLITTGILLFLLTMLRFRQRQHATFYFMASLSLAIDAGASFHATGGTIYEFTVYWWAWAAIGAATALLVETTVFPVPAGAILRKSLARAVRAEGRVVEGAVALMTGPVQESGLLAAATGVNSARIGIDSGLFQAVAPVYDDATSAGKAIQNAWRRLAPTRLEVDLYRPQRRFPGEPYRLLLTLARSALSTCMMLVYPVQSGRMHCGLCWRYREALQGLAAAFAACCCAVADVIEANAPVPSAVAVLADMEAAFAALSASTRGSFKGQLEGPAGLLSQDSLALDMVLSLLFTICTRLRRMIALLPGAVGRDQPGAAVPVAAHFRASQGWDFFGMVQVPLQRSSSIDQLRASLLGAGLAQPPKRTPSALALALMAQPSLLRATPAGETDKRRRRPLVQAAQRVLAATGFSTHHLKLALQTVVAYSVVMVLVMIPAVNDAVGGRLAWALFITVALIEPSTGAIFSKAIQRFVGTAIGSAAGLSATYFTLLCNGLSYENRPAKFIVMTIVLSLLSGCGAAATVRFPKFSYASTIAVVMLCVTSLPGYSTDSPNPKMALWRVVTTAIGITVELAVVVLVFPVTARELFTDTMASTLDIMADVADKAFHSLVPRQARSSTRFRKRSQQQQAQQQQQQQEQQQQHEEQQQQQQQSLEAKAAQSPNATSPSQQPEPQEQAPCLGEAAQQGQLAATSASTAANGTLGAATPQVSLQAPARVVEAAQRPSAGQAGLPSEHSPGQIGMPFEHSAGQAGALHLQAVGEEAVQLELVVVPPQPEAYPVVEEEDGSSISNFNASLEEAAAGLEPAPSRTLSLTMPAAAAAAAAAATANGVAAGASRGSSGPWATSAQTPSRRLSSRDQGLTVTSSSSLQRSMSETPSQLSVYVPLPGAANSAKVFGRHYRAFLPTALTAGAGVVAMLQLNTALEHEYYLFSRPHRFPFGPGYRAQRLCRHMLNVIASFAISLDSIEARGVPALMPHAARVDRLIAQLCECLRAFAGLVRGHVSADSAVDLVVSLEQHAERLFLAVILEGAAGEGAGGEVLSEADIVHGLAFVGMVFNAAYVCRLLCVALVQTFRTECPADLERVSTLLDDQSRWSVDDALMLVATQVMGLAMGGASDPSSPRRPSTGPPPTGSAFNPSSPRRASTGPLPIGGGLTLPALAAPALARR